MLIEIIKYKYILYLVLIYRGNYEEIVIISFFRNVPMHGVW